MLIHLIYLLDDLDRDLYDLDHDVSDLFGGGDLDRDLSDLFGAVI